MLPDRPDSMTSARPTFDVIIVHYHAASLVRDAVSSLQRDARESGMDVTVLVADNGSTPDERQLLQSLPVTYLPTGRDAGYAGAANFAFDRTGADFLILMNEDIVVVPGCLRALHAELERGAAVAGPEFSWDLDRVFLLPCTEERTRANELAKAAGRRSAAALRRARERWRGEARRHWRAQHPMKTIALSGALLAFRRDTWMRVGPWDDRYQMYFDENDWLLRVEQAGLESSYVPEAKVIHLHNPKLMGNPDRTQWSSESFLRFGNRYYGERFMRRLFQIASRPAVIPEWKSLPVEADGTTVEIDLPEGSSPPLWIELTPSPFGYPAAATRITDSKARRWRLPAMRGLPFLTGTFYLEVVDDAGRELGRYSFERRNTVRQQSADREEISA